MSEMKHPRIWFKEDMKRALLAGKKTTTTRYKQHKNGLYLAVTGSYYDAKPFAVIQIVSSEAMTWDDVLSWHYAEEGFESPWHMEKWGREQKLLKGSGYLEDHVYLHHLLVVGVPHA
jgi:uncharacterized protein YqfB (UPF0267 family)